MEEIKKLINEKIKNLNLYVYDITYVKGVSNTLNIILDSSDTIDIETIVKATKIISPLLDEKSFIKESYVLDIHSKEKGSGQNE